MQRVRFCLKKSSREEFFLLQQNKAGLDNRTCFVLKEDNQAGMIWLAARRSRSRMASPNPFSP